MTMKRSTCALFVAATLLLGGCGNSLMKRQPDIVGKYRGEIQMPESSKDDPGAALAKGMADMMSGMMSLEILPENKFRMTAMGIPLDGSYTRSGDKLTLTATKIFGMTAADAAKNPDFKATNMDEPIEAEVREDGKVIAFVPKSETGETTLFRRIPNEESSTSDGPRTVKSSEAGFVGSYAGDKSTLDESKLKGDNKQDPAVLRAIIESASLTLKANNQFDLMLMMELKGTWNFVNGKVELTPSSAGGMSGADFKADKLVLTPKPDGLFLDAKSDGEPGFLFRKK
jgi:hypothetical protein